MPTVAAALNPLPASAPVRLPTLARLALAATLALGGAAAQAATDPAVEAQLKLLTERLQQLEKRNQDLEQKVQELSKAAPAPAPAGAAAPAGTWGAAPAERLATLERRVNNLAPAPEEDEAGEGGSDEMKVEGGLIAVGQNVNSRGAADGRRETRFNYRGDVEVTLPLGSVGDAKSFAFGNLRFGQGGGLALRPTHTATGNSVPFEAGAGSDETYAIVAQAYYQLDFPLEGDRFNDLPGNRFEVTLGKIDIFGFFDQNAVAGDEGAQFLNNVFVHNALLDSGGDIAADAYGFAPGLRLAYINEGDSLGWGASLGVFAAGAGANFDGGLGRPLVIGQIDLTPKQINGEARGSYRLYAWTNGQTTDLDGNPQRHSGYGLSVDQKVGAEWNLFGRWGQRTSGDGNFDRALTLGFEHGGRLWGRRNDAVGLAAGWVKTSGIYRDATGGLASGAEQIAEAYYRMKLNDHLEISPDFQLIRRPGGEGSASSIKLFGVRASVGF
ncbi:MAG TPA: carbohydrate porin [Ideonella sp.]|nr:carbohydrate porin [Ideonella sp.]